MAAFASSKMFDKLTKVLQTSRIEWWWAWGVGKDLRLTKWPQPKNTDGKLHAEVKRWSLVDLLNLVVSKPESSVSQVLPYETQCSKMLHEEKFPEKFWEVLYTTLTCNNH